MTHNCCCLLPAREAISNGTISASFSVADNQNRSINGFILKLLLCIVLDRVLCFISFP